MALATQGSSGKGDGVKVGTTGRVGSLMTQEMECVKRATRCSSHHSPRKHQAEVVSGSCDAVPRKAVRWRKQPPSKHGSSSNNGVAQPRRRCGLRVPMLRGDDGLTDGDVNSDKVEKKGGVWRSEAIDLECRPSKLGFSKL
ncbi:hypothetical protein OPV22_027771 [Ensete ventricosum]|uniref:Uncharacterized protein n=1 Tax=Ensete ventricosum TaxID=4639 RepID=A0AAV8Q8K2_ENSVE|nr:hypothetical protein OPV22_027771 [Ensete ventricosum]